VTVIRPFLTSTSIGTSCSRGPFALIIDFILSQTDPRKRSAPATPPSNARGAVSYGIS
jgi:hypothetical protein